jgi:hypothetical protein
MDLLSSILQTNSEISFKEITRLYFGQFPVKLVFDFELNPTTFSQRHFINVAKSYLNSAGVAPAQGRVRQDGYLVTVFIESTSTAQQLIDHVDLVCNNSSVDLFLVAMEFPLSQQRQDHLRNDGVVRNKNFKYRYKVIITNGLSRNHQAAINELMKSIAEDLENFHISRGVRNQLGRTYYFYDNHYYCNDLGHITWIQLLDPKFIKKIQPVMNET